MSLFDSNVFNWLRSPCLDTYIILNVRTVGSSAAQPRPLAVLYGVHCQPGGI